MGLKKLASYKGFAEQELYYDVIEWRVLFKKAIEEEEEQSIEAEEATWRIIIKVVTYASPAKVEALTSPYEYEVGTETDVTLINYKMVMGLAKLHKKFLNAVEV